MKLLQAVTTGLKKGSKTTLKLAKITVPIYIVVKILELTPIFPMLGRGFSPFMGLFNLPGEAALPIMLGNFINIYAGLGALSALNLTGPQITTISVILSFSHTMFVETAVIKGAKVNVFKMVMLRIVGAIVFGILVGQTIGR